MKTFNSTLCLSLISFVSVSLFACDHGGLDGQFVPNITTSEIKRHPSYTSYANADGKSSKSWEQINNKVVVKDQGSYKALSNSYAESFQLGGVTWRSVKQYCQSIGSKDLDVMARAVYMKFAQNQSLKALLLGTGSAVIVDDADTRDNYLGRILMIVRVQLGGKQATS